MKSSLSSFHRALAEKLLAPICAGGVPGQVRVALRFEGASVILVEERPSFRDPRVWHDTPVAKFTYVKSIDCWRLFCMFRDLKWHGYAPLPQSQDLETLVKEVRKDPTCIFWG